MTFNPDSDLQREVAGQPDDWAGVVARLPELADCPAGGAARGWRSSAAARRTSWPRRTRRCASRPVTARPTRSRPASTGSTAATTPSLAITRSGTTTEVIEVLSVAARPRRRHDGDRRHARHARSPSWPTGPSCCPRSTSSRSCRPGSPPPPSRCCGPRLGEDLGGRRRRRPRVLAEDEAQRLAGARRRRAGDLRRPRLDHRPG